MITLIRRFNDLGVEKFRTLLYEIRSGQRSNIPESLLVDGALSEIVNSNIKVENRIYSSKEELIKYIGEITSRIEDKRIFNDSGFWTWMSAFYFDSICPLRKDGKRKIGEDSRYILNSAEWNRYYRHLLASPSRLYIEIGELAKLYLTGSPEKRGDLFEQIASRQDIAASRGIIEAATRLYWDGPNCKIKRGAMNKDGPGVLRRFVQSTIPQLQMTYDLNSMSGDEIVKLLPREYQKWLGD